ncbi:MAG: DNA translocase FtsK 4TM domain-containing protein, partial [Pseudolabrys sp.]
MRAADRSLDIIAFVSEHFRDIIRRRLSELAGLALISLALLGAIALATWSIQDPSLSHATQKPIHNLLGFPGAIFSDLAMQLLGLASILLLVPEVLLGWRLVSHRPMGEKWRSLLWIVATFLAAAFASALPHIVSWPLPTGLGGVAGDAVLRVPAWIFGSPLGGFTRFILCILFGLATVVTLLLAARIPDRAEKSAAREVDSDEVERDEADGDHASAWLGMIVHALLSWKARIGRMIRGDVRARTPMPVAQSPRHEPRFDGEDSEYEDGEEDDEEAPAPRRRAAARAPSRRGTNGYTLPSLN